MLDNFSQFKSLIKPNSTIAIAVSGGADSMALLLLIKEWLASSGKELKINLHAITVDHNLRKESAEEAKQVASYCRKLGIKHDILLWKHDGINSGIQEKARNARYELICEFCIKNKIELLFTAHHLDDQIETMFMRLLRGSFMLGMSGILPITKRGRHEEITIIRPLLSLTKSQLVEFLHTRNQEWLEDPSNKNLNYSRNFIRNKLQQLSDSQKQRLAELNLFFQRFRKIIESHLESALHESLLINKLDHSKFMNQPQELKKLILQHICCNIGNKNEPPRSEKLERLLDKIENITGKNKTGKNTNKHTLHGVMFSYIKNENIWKIELSKK